MATKKKVKAVEPEVFSSVEPEVAAVTPRSNGQSTNGFAKVEQGKSYVLSVNAPSGPGEVELLAADSNTQFEPDMFSLLYTKVENSMQIPFVAVSSWVYVQAGSSSINWLVTRANFSLAVPGVSSGGGESFVYNTTIQSAELATGSAVTVTLPEDAPEGMYEIRFISATPTGTGLSVQPSDFRVKVTSSNPPGSQLANTATALGKSNLIIYEDENGSLKKVVPFMGMIYKIPANCTVVSAQQYMYHVQGGSDKVSFSMPSIAEGVTPKSVNITFIQIA